ncbi:TPA: hypothetical protein DDW35_06065 [Candidatus Sumerlaeota bacterium]|jgi:hypothetical protein|nr:hypothetical protein [Candidatus Sumerlaeota bacterium]
MSTILDALRKAKQAPTRDSVDARPEIINGTSHDYLATAPDSPETQLRNLRTIVMIAGCAIAFLFLLVIILLSVVFHKMGAVPAPLSSNNSTIQSTQSLPAEPVEPAVAVATPQPTPIVVYIAAPTPAPTPAVTAAPVAPPVVATPALEFPVQAPSEALELRGILWDETSPMAMINGKSVLEGAIVSGYTIKTIQKSSVTVISPNGEESTLKP